MAPDKKRPASPIDPPQWLHEWLESHQHSLRQQEVAIREVRLLTLKNQQMLREIIASAVRKATVAGHSRPLASAVIPINNRPGSRSCNQPTSGPSTKHAVIGSSGLQPRANSSSSAVSSSTNGIRQTIPNPSSKGAIAAQNAAIRQAAAPIPRASRPMPQAVRRACWFHRQFGPASIRCLQPCSFTVPEIPPAISQPILVQQPAVSQQQPIDPQPVVVNQPAVVVPPVKKKNPPIKDIVPSVNEELPQVEQQIPPVKQASHVDGPNNPQPPSVNEPQVDTNPQSSAQVSAVTLRLPLERVTGTKRASGRETSSSEASTPSTKSQKTANWNESSSSSSSSDSDSDN